MIMIMIIITIIIIINYYHKDLPFLAGRSQFIIRAVNLVWIANLFMELLFRSLVGMCFPAKMKEMIRPKHLEQNISGNSDISGNWSTSPTSRVCSKCWVSRKLRPQTLKNSHLPFRCTENSDLSKTPTH